ncbi:MAG: hypothetical protein H0X31_15555 [Nostocaceae cyanobacterium]|nr:hypothetical protein [Nostocaceae cyanobacterium]
MAQALFPRSNDVRYEAINALIKRLGIAKTAFFIREMMSQPVDYLKVKDRLFENMAFADICSEI